MAISDTAVPQEQKAVAFPPENIDPKRKQGAPGFEAEGKEWHLQTAKAIWYFNATYAPKMFYNDRDEYKELIEFAFGDQSEEFSKPALGINPENAAHSHIGGINWETKKFAIKRVKTTASKVFNKQYDPVATAIDPTSSDRRASTKAAIKMVMDHGAWMAERQEFMEMLPEGIDLDNIPINDDDLNIFMQNDFKLNQEIVLELGMTYHINRLDFDETKKKFDWYLTVLPVCGVWVGLDENDLPAIDPLNPKKIVTPSSEFEDYQRMFYGAYVDELTVPEFRKKVGNSLPQHEIENIILQHARRGDYTIRDVRYHTEEDKNVDKIWVLHFEVRQTDVYTYLEKPDEEGNMRLHEKPFDYYRKEGSDKAGNPYPTEEDFNKKYKGTRKIHRITKPTTYGGYWVLDSDYVFRWGERNHLKGELGFKLRASNMVDGHATSMVKQMIPCIKAIERYDKKIQSIVASALHQTIKIDLAALRKVQYKIGDQQASNEQLIDMFLQKGIILVDTSDSPVGSTNTSPVEVLQAGISKDIVAYIDLMKFELEQMDEIIGYNKVSSASSLSPETGARVAQQQEMATETALDHLYQADRALCKEIYEALAHLHRVSVQRNPKYYIPILGEQAVMQMLQSASHDDYGIDIEARPTQLEWNQFYMQLDKMEANGTLKPQDRPQLMRFQNLKQAYSYLKVMTRKREKAAQAFELEKITTTTEQQTESAKIAAAEALRVAQFERETQFILADKEIEKAKKTHQYKMREITALATLQNAGDMAQTEMEGEYGLAEASIKAKAAAKNKTAPKK